MQNATRKENIQQAVKLEESISEKLYSASLAWRHKNACASNEALDASVATLIEIEQLLSRLLTKQKLLQNN